MSNAASKQPTKRKATGRPFQPGNPGNPRGRPPAGLAVAELFRGVMEEQDRERRKPRVVALALKLYEMAMSGKGNVFAAKALLEWSVAKPAQRITGEDGPIEIVIRRASEAK